MRKNKDTRMLTSCFCKINLFKVNYRVCLLSLFPSNVCLEEKKKKKESPTAAGRNVPTGTFGVYNTDRIEKMDVATVTSPFCFWAPHFEALPLAFGPPSCFIGPSHHICDECHAKLSAKWAKLVRRLENIQIKFYSFTAYRSYCWSDTCKKATTGSN